MNELQRAQRFNDIREIGCLACRRYGWFSAPDVHHLNLGGHAGQKRRGDECTVGLCPWHHRGIHEPPVPVGPSMAKQPRFFRVVFGSDNELLKEQNDLIAEVRSRRVA